MGTVLGHGLLGSIPFFAVFLGFCRRVAKEAQLGGMVAMIYFLGVASSSVSLSAKTPVFGIFVLLLMILGRREPVAPAGFAARVSGGWRGLVPAVPLGAS